MKPVLLALTSLLLSAFAAGAAGNCLTDTTQANFQAGVANSLDLTSSPGDVMLTSTAGSPSPDAQNTSITSNGELFSYTQWNAQTFTAGKSGPLSRVDVNLFCYFCGTAPPPITVSIRATSGGVPTGGDLAPASSTVISNWSVGAQAWFTVNFATPATVSAGTQYALVVRPSASYANGTLAFSNSAISSSTGNDVYGGGKLLFSTNSGSSWTTQMYGTTGTSDAGFKTYVGSGGGTTSYNSAGDLISSVKDGGTSPTWSTVSWTGSTPTGTALKFQAAASSSATGTFTFVGPDGTSQSYYTSGASLDRFNGSRYLKYRAFLSTTNSAATPTLSDATVCYTAPSADLSISNDDGVTSVAAGGSTTYRLVATNNGPSNVTGATVADTFPASLTCSWTCSASAGSSCPASGSGNISNPVNLLSGGSATFTASCTISAAASGTLTNTATIAAPASISDPVATNNSASDSDAVNVNSSPPGISLTDSVEFVRVGDPVSYVIHVTNPGTSISPTITDALPAQLSGQSWVCTPSGGATCGSPSGSGSTLSDTPTLPTGSAVDYTFTASVLAADASGQVSNTVSMKITGKAATISASDADTVVVFISGFEGGTTPLAMTTAGSSATGSVTAQLGVDGSLLAKLGVVPVTVASAHSASGQMLFSLQLMRSGNDVLLRSLTTIDGGPFSDVSPWQVVDLRGLRLGFEWQSATTRGDDGFLNIATGNSRMSFAASNEKALVTRLQIAVENDIPWLLPIVP